MSIRIKILVGLVLVFALLIGAINLFMLENIRMNDEKSITKDLNAIESNGQFYVKQDLLINNNTIDPDSFASEADEVVSDLSNTTNISFAAYGLTGQLIASNNEAVFKNLPNNDLRLATGGKTAYTIKNSEGKTTATFSFPVILNGQKIGILRCISDYTSVYSQSEQSIRQINIITLSGFLICLLFAAVLSRSVITPIRRLCINLKITAGDIQSNHLDPNKIREHVKLTRKDEIGDLSRSIVDLIDKISQQMTVINSDRDELSRVSAYRRDFYNVVTHELKTPLTSIKGYAEVARDNGFTDREFFDKAMTRIMEESDRLHEMVVSLLEESNLNSAVEMPFGRVNFTEIAQNVCDSMKYKADKYGREIRLHPTTEAWVLGNPQSLKELVINLLDNAIKYTSGNDIEVRVSQNSEHVIFEILNSADILSQEEADHLFTPFYRNQESAHEKGSVGLGLSICKQISEKHKGTILLTVTGKGKLSATVRLPIYRGL
jgi:signal transduction histidine kinase